MLSVNERWVTPSTKTLEAPLFWLNDVAAVRWRDFGQRVTMCSPQPSRDDPHVKS